MTFYIKITVITISLLFLSQLQAFMPTVPGHEYAILMVMSDESSLNSTQKENLLEMRRHLADSYPLVFSQLRNSFNTERGIHKAITNSLLELRKIAEPKLRELNSQLTHNPIYLATYLVPWKTELIDENNTLNSFGNYLPSALVSQMPRILPISFPSRNDRYTFFHRLKHAIFAAQKAMMGSKDPAYFAGAGFILTLQKNNSRFDLQIMGGMNSKKESFAEENEQVKITHLEVPINNNPLEQPSVLISLAHNFYYPTAPEARFEFGKFGGFSGGINGKTATFQLEKLIGWLAGDRTVCEFIDGQAPRLLGTLKRKAVSNSLIGGLVDGAPVVFKIQDLTLDIEKIEVTQMNLRLEVKLGWGPLHQKCLQMQSVNRQFEREVNSTISAKINEFYRQDDLTDELLNYLLQPSHYE